MKTLFRQKLFAPIHNFACTFWVGFLHVNFNSHAFMQSKDLRQIFILRCVPHCFTCTLYHSAGRLNMSLHGCYSYLFIVFSCWLANEWALAKHYSNPQGITKHKCSSGNPYKITSGLMTEPNTRVLWQLLSENAALPQRKIYLVSAPFCRPGFMGRWEE